MKAVTILAAASAMSISAAAAAAPQVDIAATGPVVELTVFENVEIAPDTSTIGAGVSTEAATATEALRLNSVEMKKVVDRIKSLGIAARDIQTTGINLNPRYDYDQTTQRQIFRGYQASNRVSIKLRKVADTGRVLDALVAAGATDLNGPTFSIDDDTAAKKQARERAVARATAQAKDYAGMFGYSGARVLAINESLTGMPMPFESAKLRVVSADVSAPVAPVEPGMVSAGVTVTVTFELTGAPAAR